MANDPKNGDQAENARKALRMKQQAGSDAKIPPHRTPNRGAIKESQVDGTDTAIGKEPTWTPNLKRSHNPRSGDA